MFSKIISSLQKCFAVFLALFLFLSAAEGKDIKPITPKLWKVFSVEELQDIEKIATALGITLKDFFNDVKFN